MIYFSHLLRLRRGSHELDYNDRFELAIEWLRMRYDERNQFLSDSDLLDAADLFTTSVRDDNDDTGWRDGNDVDYRLLVARLDFDVFGDRS